MPQIKDVTTEQVGNKLKNSFKRIKTMWETTNKEIRKNEKKQEKLSEELFELKEQRENLENELEGIRSTYEQFCEETGQKYSLI